MKQSTALVCTLLFWFSHGSCNAEKCPLARWICPDHQEPTSTISISFSLHSHQLHDYSPDTYMHVRGSLQQSINLPAHKTMWRWWKLEQLEEMHLMIGRTHKPHQQKRRIKPSSLGQLANCSLIILMHCHDHPFRSSAIQKAGVKGTKFDYFSLTSILHVVLVIHENLEHFQLQFWFMVNYSQQVILLLSLHSSYEKIRIISLRSLVWRVLWKNLMKFILPSTQLD